LIASCRRAFEAKRAEVLAEDAAAAENADQHLADENAELVA
jgi:hypothetical protein